MTVKGGEEDQVWVRREEMRLDRGGLKKRAQSKTGRAARPAPCLYLRSGKKSKNSSEPDTERGGPETSRKRGPHWKGRVLATRTNREGGMTCDRKQLGTDKRISTTGWGARTGKWRRRDQALGS